MLFHDSRIFASVSATHRDGGGGGEGGDGDGGVVCCGGEFIIEIYTVLYCNLLVDCGYGTTGCLLVLVVVVDEKEDIDWVIPAAAGVGLFCRRRWVNC